MNNERSYRTWYNMISRCKNKNNSSYKNYGGRGIKVCDRWLQSFENFYKDMGYPPTIKHTIDRINNDGNYEPSNCRWATHKIQQNNKSNNRFLTIDGITKTIGNWASESGIAEHVIIYRLNKGWSGTDSVFSKLWDKNISKKYPRKKREIYMRAKKNIKNDEKRVKKLKKWLDENSNGRIFLANKLNYAASSTISLWIIRKKIPDRAWILLEPIINEGGK
jgi:hypothetical protein